MSENAAQPKLTKAHREALAELIRYTDRGQRYWWRRASMRSLLYSGLVEVSRVGSNERLNEYLPTPAGRAALSPSSTEPKA